jgi:hypothetical protein
MIAGCGGRGPNPIQTHSFGDDQLTCQEIEMEMASIDQKMRQLFPDTYKTGKNVGLGVAGCFLFPCWFFMDFSDAQRVEIDALRTRYDRLNRLATRKNCTGKANTKKDIVIQE